MNRKAILAACLSLLIIFLSWLSGGMGRNTGRDPLDEDSIRTDASEIKTETDNVNVTVPERFVSARSFDADIARILDALGIVLEAEHGYELNVEASRLDGIITFIRLIGKEEAAKKESEPDEFADVPDWAAGYVNYALRNGFVESRESGYFGAQESIELPEFVDMITKLLGYDEFIGMPDAALSLGLMNEIELDNVSGDAFLWGDMLKITYAALSLTYPENGMTLRDAFNKSSIKKTNSGKNILLGAYIEKNKKNHTQAIIEACRYLRSTGGGTLVFEKGDYLIEPERIFIPSDVEWLGEDGARLFTREKSLYNVLISTELNAKNIRIKNIIFDQSEDSPLIPDVDSYKGCFLLHINEADNVTVEGCTFYAYGACAVLSQSTYETGTQRITVVDNAAYFQRKTDRFYDVSVFNIDGRDVTVKGNYIRSMDKNESKHWKARTSIEVHMPAGIVEDNIMIDSEVGILHVGWPMLWEVYSPDADERVRIIKNRIEGAIVGISCWGPTTVMGIETRDLEISDNHIGLKITEDYIPTQGIAFVNGDIGYGEYINVSISNNMISFTDDEGITDREGAIDRFVPGGDTGALCINTTNRISGLKVYGNIVSRFPFAFLNLYKRDPGNEENFHSDIEISNNIITDSCYIRTYGSVYEGLFSIGNTRDIVIRNNTVQKLSKDPLYLLSLNDALDGLIFIENDLSSLIDGVEYDYTDFDILAGQVYDIPYLNKISVLSYPAGNFASTVISKGVWLDARRFLMMETFQLTAGDILLTPNDQPVMVTKSDGRYISLLNEMASWEGEGDIKIASEHPEG